VDDHDRRARAELRCLRVELLEYPGTSGARTKVDADVDTQAQAPDADGWSSRERLRERLVDRKVERGRVERLLN